MANATPEEKLGLAGASGGRALGLPPWRLAATSQIGFHPQWSSLCAGRPGSHCACCPGRSLPGADSHQLPLGCFWPSVSVARGSASSESIGSSVQFPPYFRAPPDTHTPCLYVPVGYTKNHWPPRVPGPCCWALRDVGGDPHGGLGPC